MKPGIKSTEWWAVLLVTAITLLNHLSGWGIEADTELIIGGLAAIYAVGRSIVKAASGRTKPNA